MTDLDSESLELTLSQNDLELHWHIGQSAVGNESLKQAPKKAHFFWCRETQQVYGIEATRNELEDLIRTLKHRGLTVPNQFNEALGELPA